MGNHERISAARALEIGLVTEVVPMAALAAAAHRIATAIASQPAAAVQASLRSLWAARELTRGQMIDVGNTFLNLAMSEKALTEGQQVFASGAAHRPRRPVTLAATVREAARRFGPRPAFVDPDGSRLSYADARRPLRRGRRRAARRRAWDRATWCCCACRRRRPT